MSMTDVDIDRIVRQVCQQVQAAEGTQRANQPEATSRTTSEAVPIAGRIVSLRDLQGKPAEARRIVVAPDAVLTPAARDWLRERGVEVVRSESSPLKSQNRGTSLTLAVSESEYDPGMLIQALRRGGIDVSMLPQSELVASIQEMVSGVVQDGRPGLMFTNNLPLALCLANRQRGIRAVEGRDAAQTREAIKSVGANLVIVNPTGRALFELVGICRELAHARACECPEPYRVHLQ